MCRLFGLHAGRVPATATFWLLDAPDNLSEQSRRNPDATGIGVFALITAAIRSHGDVERGVTRRIALPDPPRHQLSLEDLTGAAATSQHEPAASGR